MENNEQSELKRGTSSKWVIYREIFSNESLELSISSLTSQK